MINLDESCESLYEQLFETLLGFCGDRSIVVTGEMFSEKKKVQLYVMKSEDKNK